VRPHIRNLVTLAAASRSPLAAALCALLGCQAASATLRYVTACDDDGADGTLRSVVAASLEGDEIDLHTQPLSCSTITLAQGVIAIDHGVKLVGRADRSLAIAGNGASPLLQSTGMHYLGIDSLVLKHGIVSGVDFATGGCIAGHTVVVNNATLTDCSVHTTDGMTGGGASGGAIWSTGSVQVTGSRIDSSAATDGGAAAPPSGGAIAAPVVTCTDSTLSGNTVYATAFAAKKARGAAIFASAQLTLNRCTIDGNLAASGFGAGAYRSAVYLKTGGTMTLTNSTISGNFAYAVIAAGKVNAYNSTIAFNRGGVRTSDNVYAYSSIFSSNGANDLYFDGHQYLYGFANFVGSTNCTTICGAAIGGGSHPRLTPLAYHGGATRVHALMASSSLIDAGTNNPGADTDQRGAARESPTGKPDIGAYERQPDDDELFYDGAEGYP
jgi:hypothetical protein